MRLWEFEAKVNTEQSKEGKIYQRVLIILFSYLNDFLGGKGSQGSDCRYCPKSNCSNLLRVYLNHIDEEYPIVVSHTVP